MNKDTRSVIIVISPDHLPLVDLLDCLFYVQDQHNLNSIGYSFWGLSNQPIIYEQGIHYFALPNIYHILAERREICKAGNWWQDEWQCIHYVVRRYGALVMFCSEFLDPWVQDSFERILTTEGLSFEVIIA